MQKKYSKQDLIDAVIEINSLDINSEIKKKIFDKFLWWISEYGGKYNFDKRFYTKKAKEQREENLKNKIKNKNKSQKWSPFSDR